MDKRYQLIAIRVKLFLGEPLLPEEEQLWNELLDNPAMRDLYNIPDETIKELVRSELHRKTFEEFVESMAHKGYLQPIKVEWWRRRAVLRIAAVLLAIVLTGLIYLLVTTPKKEATVPSAIRPATEEKRLIAQRGPYLQTTDGRQYPLGKDQAPIRISQGNVLTYTDSSALLQYQISGSPTNMEAGYNTIVTPVGSTYRVRLSDGTVVLLNASSSIRFPVPFTGDSREITLTGEAYFVASRDRAELFKVKAGAAEIQVMGTTFNINAYANEPMLRTTLLNGKISINVGGKPVQLKPGETVGIAGQHIRQLPLDTSHITAWTRNYFSFEMSSVKEILHDLQRWYLNPMVIEDNLDENEVMISGLPKTTPLPEILEHLHKGNLIDYRLQNDTFFIRNFQSSKNY